MRERRVDQLNNKKETESTIITYAEHELSRYETIKSEIEDYDVSYTKPILEILKRIVELSDKGCDMNKSIHIVKSLYDYRPIFPISDSDFTVPDEEKPGLVFGTYSYYGITKCINPITKEITYRDINRVRAIDDRKNDEFLLRNKLISDIIDDLYPIELPYLPSSNPRFIVHIDKYIINTFYNRFDLLNVKYGVDKLTDTKFEINRYFTKLGTIKRDEIKEITKEEFDKLVSMKEVE